MDMALTVDGLVLRVEMWLWERLAMQAQLLLRAVDEDETTKADRTKGSSALLQSMHTIQVLNNPLPPKN